MWRKPHRHDGCAEIQKKIFRLIYLINESEAESWVIMFIIIIITVIKSTGKLEWESKCLSIESKVNKIFVNSTLFLSYFLLNS